MKKFYIGAFVGLGALLLLTGCGGAKNQLKCTTEVEQNGQKYKGEIIAKYDDKDKIKDVSMTMTFGSTDEADQTYGMLLFAMNMAQQFSEEGQEVPKIDIKKDGKSITISDYAAYASFSSDTEEEKLIGMAKEDFIKKMESEEDAKWECK